MCKRVTSRTVGFFGIDIGDVVWRIFSEVLFGRDWFQMKRVNACSVFASVMKMFTFRDWPNEKLIGNPISVPCPSVMKECSTSSSADAGQKRPALSLAVLSYFFHESIHCALIHAHLCRFAGHSKTVNY